MSGVTKVAAYSVARGDGSAVESVGKKRKKRKKRNVSSQEALSDDGWRKIDLQEMEIEGYEDGSMFELEELTDYTFEASESGGRMLVFGKNKDNVAIKSEANVVNEVSEPEQKKRKRKKGKQQQAEEKKKEETAKAAAIKTEPGDDSPVKDEPVVQVKQEEQSATEKQATKSKVTPKKEQKTTAPEAKPKKEKQQQQKPAKKETKSSKETKQPGPVTPVELPHWDKFKLHPLLRHSLHACGFLTPTPIQDKTIYPALIDHRDIVGAAPTGSGKTLAFGLSILSQLLFEKEQPGYVKACKALILSPTRELALQIQKHLEKMVPHREVGVMTLVGGMSIQKQQRMLSYQPEVVIGTPGRLWDLIDSNHTHLKELHETLRFLVIDEADRMLQTGSFAEVEKIFDVLRHSGKRNELKDLSDSESDDADDEGEGGEDDDDEEGGGEERIGAAKVMMLDDVLRMHRQLQEKDAKKQQKPTDQDDDDKEQRKEVARRIPRQTFLFSATLTIPEGGRFQSGKRKHKHALTVLESVMKRVGMRGRPAVVDMSIKEDMANKQMSEEETAKLRKKQAENVALSLPAGLELCQHEVTDDSRDTYLYYFLTQYPGKTIVFLNSIHQVRKLANLLTLLKLPVFALHAEMQQRQRLKKLDNFRANDNAILIATDVAARGLDIPSVDYVVHYHIARSTEVFVHRSGRTARANKEGLSVSLVAPADAKYHTQICKMLQRPTGLAEFPFDHRYLPVLDERLRLAKAINEHESVMGKVKSEESWFMQMAKEADLDMDDNLLNELTSKKNKGDTTKKKNGESVESMRHELARLVAEPLRPIGSARKFRQLHQELGSSITLDGEYKKRNASHDLETKSKKSYKRFRRR